MASDYHVIARLPSRMRSFVSAPTLTCSPKNRAGVRWLRSFPILAEAGNDGGGMNFAIAIGGRGSSFCGSGEGEAAAGGRSGWAWRLCCQRQKSSGRLRRRAG